jgi:hypothetical protein
VPEAAKLPPLPSNFTIIQYTFPHRRYFFQQVLVRPQTLFFLALDLLHQEEIKVEKKDIPPRRKTS